MRLVTGSRSVRLTTGSLAAFAALGLGVPTAAADPAVEPVVPAPVAAPVTPAAAPAPAPGDPAAVAQSATPPDGMSHLPSPDSLPPGTTQAAPEHPTLDYLKDVWNALRTKEVSASDALLLLAQRPVDDSKVAESVPQSQSGPAAPAPAPVAVAPAPVPAAGAPAAAPAG